MTAEGKVLVVDSERAVTELIARRLGEAGFDVVSASSAREALATVRSARPTFDVMLVGTRLPDGSGLELVRHVRRDTTVGSVSIVLMTVLRDPEETLRALEAGADDCLRKPVHRVELVARVRSLQRIKRQLDELRYSNARLAELNDHLDRTATTDPLTGLANRRQLEVRLAQEVERSERYRHPLSVLVLDVDHFKRVNDTYGHAVGDDVLKMIAQLLHRSVRRVDLAARYGGEELVVVAPSTGLQGAATLAERVRASVAGASVEVPNIPDDLPQPLRVTVSIGVAEWEPGMDAHALFRAADGALYEAKEGGRDRVVLAGAAAGAGEDDRTEPSPPPTDVTALPAR